MTFLIFPYLHMMKIEQVVGKTINGLGKVAPNLAGKLVLDLFCRPTEGKKFTAKEKAFLAEGIWHSLQLDGKKIQCYTWGNGPKKILLAHGFNSNAGRWRILSKLMQNSDYQIIALDVPAHGNSEWNRVNGLLYARVIEQVMNRFKPNYVVGHSFAGIAYAYYFSKMNPLPVEKIILLGVPNDLSDITKVYFDKLALSEKVQNAYLKAFLKKFNYPTSYFTLNKLFKNVNTPCLIIHDEQDDIASFQGAKLLHQSWSNSTFLPTENLGHSLQGRSVYKAILDFVKN